VGFVTRDVGKARKHKMAFGLVEEMLGLEANCCRGHEHGTWLRRGLKCKPGNEVSLQWRASAGSTLVQTTMTISL
jgi:hypothetical protein